MPARVELKTIVHMDLDTFFVSVERLKNSTLNGKPVIIGGGSDRGVVASCSYEARKFGVHSAMPMKLARRLCPQAVCIRGDMEEYSRHSATVTEIIQQKAPLFEKASIDEHYIDISGMDRFIGSYQWTHELRSFIIRHTGLPLSFGLSVNKTVSKIATGEAKPSGELRVSQPEIRPFLSPLSISKIPGVGGKTYQSLRRMGIDRIRTISEMPVELMESLLGENGRHIWMKANGLDDSPVIPYSEQKSISTETTLDRDTSDMGLLNGLLAGMTEKVLFELRGQQKLAGCLTVKLRYSNFDTHTLQKRIPYTAFDHLVLPRLREMFDRLYNRRMLIRLIGIRLSSLVQGVHQIDMFQDTPEQLSLYLVMDGIRQRFGSLAIRHAAGIPPG